MKKRCRGCIYFEDMKVMARKWRACDSRHYYCLDCSRFPKIRKMHPDKFDEKSGQVE